MKCLWVGASSGHGAQYIAAASAAYVCLNVSLNKGITGGIKPLLTSSVHPVSLPLRQFDDQLAGAV